MSDDLATNAAKELADGKVNPLTGGQGAQIALTGAAQAAARGETAGSIAENTTAREEAMAAGETADGATNVAVEAKSAPAPADEPGAKAKPAAVKK